MQCANFSQTSNPNPKDLHGRLLESSHAIYRTGSQHRSLTQCQITKSTVEAVKDILVDSSIQKSFKRGLFTSVAYNAKFCSNETKNMHLEFTHFPTNITLRATDAICITAFSTAITKNGWMAEWSKALVLGTSLRAWVRIPLQSYVFDSQESILLQVRVNTAAEPSIHCDQALSLHLSCT